MSPETIQVVATAVSAAVGGGGAVWATLRTDVRWLKQQVRELRQDLKDMRDRAAAQGIFL